MKMERIEGNRGLIIESLRLQFQQKRKSRTSDDIKAEILQFALKGALPTPIMYRCNISYSMLCNYLKRLIESGLLEKTKIKLSSRRGISKNKKYEFLITTEKGKKWLSLHRQLRELEK